MEKLQESIFAQSKNNAENKKKLAKTKAQKEAKRKQIAAYRVLIKQVKKSRAQKKLLEPVAKARMSTEDALYANIL